LTVIVRKFNQISGDEDDYLVTVVIKIFGRREEKLK